MYLFSLTVLNGSEQTSLVKENTVCHCALHFYSREDEAQVRGIHSGKIIRDDREKV